MPAPIQYLVHMPERISAVAGVTLTQLVRMRLFFVPAAVALLFLGLQFIPYQANIGVGVTGTFGYLDPNNQDSVAGKVFFAIDMNGNVQTYERNLEVQATRNAYKMGIAKEIVEELIKIV